MSNKSLIEWTESTWNPVTGCTKVSPGCKNCYAEKMSKRLHGFFQSGIENGYHNGFDITEQPKRLTTPIRRKKPTLFFVNSMSDQFHEEVRFSYIDKVFNTIVETPRHTYQILTKRAGRMTDYFENREVPQNAWIGVSVEDKKYGVPRIKYLTQIDTKKRFLSIEPLLEDVGTINLDGIHWVIVGGESGPKARPMKPEWVRSIRDQCLIANVPFFFKQWGAWDSDGIKRSKKSNGNMLDGQIYEAFPP
jgi:protein gp37